MAEEDVKLLSFWSSPFAARVRLALVLKGIYFDLQEEDLFNAKSELLLESNPVHKKVPVLIHNGKAVCESLNIIEYIDEVWPDQAPNFLPRGDAFARATARFWADFVDKKFMSLNAASFRAAISDDGEEKERANDEMMQDFMALEVFLASQGTVFFSGSDTDMGLVDIAASFFPWWMPTYSEIGRLRVPNTDTCPHLCRWIDAVRNNPAAQVAYPDQEKLTAYSRARLEEVKKKFAK